MRPEPHHTHGPEVDRSGASIASLHTAEADLHGMVRLARCVLGEDSAWVLVTMGVDGIGVPVGHVPRWMDRLASQPPPREAGSWTIGPDGTWYAGLTARLDGASGSVAGWIGGLSSSPESWDAERSGILKELSDRTVDLIESRRARLLAVARLELLDAAAELLDRSISFADALGPLMVLAINTLGFENGEIWLPDDQGRVLRRAGGRLAGDGTLADEPPPSPTRLRRGEDLAGRVWECLEPAWEDNRTEDDGGWTAVGFPVLVGMRLFAVLTLRTSRRVPRDGCLVRTLRTLGRHLGGFALRVEASAEASGLVDQLGSILDASSQVAIIATDKRGTITTFNSGAERMLGYTREELVGRWSPECLHVREEVEEHARKLAEEYGVSVSGFDVFVERARRGRHDESEWTYVRKDGGWLSVWLTVTAVRDPDGRITGFLGIATDCTERKAAQEALSRAHAELGVRVAQRTEELARVSEQLRRGGRELRGLADAMPQIVWAARHDGHVDYFNSRWYEFTGFERSKSGDASWTPILHPDDLQRCLDVWYRSVSTGQPYEIQYRFLDRKEGRYRWHLGRALPLRDESGRIFRWFGTSTDIDDLRSVEEERAYLATMVQSTRDAIVGHDPEGLITFWNAGAERLFGYSAMEAIGRSTSFLIPPGREAESEAALERASLGEAGAPFESVRVTKGGRSIDVAITLSPIKSDSSRVIGFSMIARDITERKEAEAAIRQLNADLERRVGLRTAELARAKEAAEAANRAKAEFLANMSHEVRTPMAAVIGYANMLLDPTMSPEDRDVTLQAIRRNGEHLMQVIDDILDLSKIEAGRMDLDPIEYGPWRVVLEVVSLLGMRANEKGVRIELVANGLLPDACVMDPTRVRQVLMNLVSNAVKFTEPGGRVRVRASAAPLEGGRTALLQIAVEDTGIGMSPEQVRQVFQPFRQGDGSTTRRFGGTGLGLSICSRLVDAMKGRIWVESEPGRGSAFAFEIPLAVVRPDASWSEPGGVLTVEPGSLLPSGSAPPSLEGRVLLVEDSLEIRRILTHFLRRVGLSVEEAANGRSGVDMALSRRFDLVIMDMQMPELDGYGAASSLRRSGSRVPIVALTAHAMAEDRDRCLRAGCDDYIAKPVSPEVLFATLAKYLDGRPDEAAPDDDEGYGPDERGGALARLTLEFVRSLPEKSARVSAAAGRGDLATVASLAHQLRGVAGMYGHPELTETAGLLEDAVREGQELDLIHEFVADLVGEAAVLAAQCGADASLAETRRVP